MTGDGIRRAGQFVSRFPTATEFGIVIFLWMLSVAVVNPVGEFPIIDDGLYESIVKHLLNTGEFPNPEPASATLLTNIFWGTGFCLAYGVSFTALRISTLVASLLGLFGVLVLARDLRISLYLRLLTVLTLAFSPAYHTLSYSFMTDVPFAALVIWSSVFFVKSLQSRSLIYLATATILTVVAALSRQIALAMPIAYIISLFLKDDRLLSWNKILRASVPVFLPVAALWGYFRILANANRLPITYNFFSNIMISTLTHGSALEKVPFINVYITALYLGLFLLPVLLASAGGLSGYKGKIFWFLFIASLTPAAVGALIRRGVGLSDLVPLAESHVLVPSGIGLLWLRGAEGVPVLSSGFWDLVTGLAVLGSILFLAQLSAVSGDLAHLIKGRSLSTGHQVGVLFLVLSGLILLCPYLFTGASDRYLTPALPLLAVAVASASAWRPHITGRMSGIARTSATTLLIGAMIFSMIGTRDYLAWHRIAAAASEELIGHSHIQPEHIDGGVEFDAYYPAYQGHEKEIDFSDLENDPSGYVFTEEIKSQAKVVERVSWRPPTVQYIIGFESAPGYSAIQEYSYYNWMPPHRQRILVLRRN